MYILLMRTFDLKLERERQKIRIKRRQEIDVIDYVVGKKL